MIRPGFMVLVVLLLAVSGSLPAHTSQQQILDAVAYEQHIGAKLPDDVAFVDAEGAPVRLADLGDDRPLLLVMAWFECADLCPLLLERLAAATGQLPFAPDDYRVAVVSIAPDEGPAQARQLRARLQRTAGGRIAGWHFLSGDKQSIDTLAQTIGFQYAYDRERQRYAHPAGVLVIAPGGRINRYLFGMNPASRDLKLALLEAGRGELGDPVDHALLRCYRFDPETGQYSLAIMNLVRVAAGGSVLALAGLVFWLRRRERP